MNFLTAIQEESQKAFQEIGILDIYTVLNQQFESEGSPLLSENFFNYNVLYGMEESNSIIYSFPLFLFSENGTEAVTKGLYDGLVIMKLYAQKYLNPHEQYITLYDIFTTQIAEAVNDGFGFDFSKFDFDKSSSYAKVAYLIGKMNAFACHDIFFPPQIWNLTNTEEINHFFQKAVANCYLYLYQLRLHALLSSIWGYHKELYEAILQDYRTLSGEYNITLLDFYSAPYVMKRIKKQSLAMKEFYQWMYNSADAFIKMINVATPEFENQICSPIGKTPANFLWWIENILNYYKWIKLEKMEGVGDGILEELAYLCGYVFSINFFALK